MTLMFLFICLLELLLLSTRVLWRLRSVGSACIIVLIGFWLGYQVLQGFDLLLVALAFLSLFRVLNLTKLTKRVIHPDYLHKVTRRTSLTLLSVSAAVVLLRVFTNFGITDEALIALGFFQLVVALVVLGITSRNLQKTKHHAARHYYSDKELPTVTVAIPARNETDDLASCLRTVLGNDYPKLEILVLDDCSQDRTAEIIKDFAHDGVRFISGEPPQDRWLAKNQAYDKLMRNASGEIIIFCGVDVRFGTQALRSLVTSMLVKKRSMMSVLPFRIGGEINTSLVQPLRYWWELALPRRMFNRPPVLSTCWLIKRKSLIKLGGFKAVRHNILPERYFAREEVKNDNYAFIRADEHLDVKTVKSAQRQLDTAVRVRYPSLRKRPENVLGLIFLESLFLLGPLVLLCGSFLIGLPTAALLSGLALVSLIAVHYLIMSASHPFHSVLALFNYPFAIVTELAITIISMLRYEFGKVNWKGRNVCIPTMHVIKKLPKF